jgi:phosphatidylglycerophosphatase A
VIVYLLLSYAVASGLPFWLHPAAHLAMVLFGGWVCVRLAPFVIRATGRIDPGQVVADEVAGQALAMLMVSFTRPAHILLTAILGFALFRLFDIAKPAPCKRLERLPAGWGILADDLMAGLYAGALALLLIRLNPAFFG